MTQTATSKQRNIKRTVLALLLTTVVPALTGCIVIGHSTGGGWFIWPGGLGLLLVIIFVVMLLRRR